MSDVFRPVSSKRGATFSLTRFESSAPMLYTGSLPQWFRHTSCVPAPKSEVCMHAIIETGGKQYRVAPGDVIRVEKLAGEIGTEVELSVKASFREGGELVSGGKVTGTIVGADRAAKILVFKFKRKKQYKKTIGHRQSYTEVKIGEVVV